MLNYFALLGLEPRFDLSESEVHQRYIGLQRESHPDKMTHKTERERLEAIQRAMDGNEAYEALKSPLGRAQHLLALRGIQVNSEDDTVKPDHALLIEMMELREHIESAASPLALGQVVDDIKKAAALAQKALADCFARSAWDEAAQQTIRLRYLMKSLEEAHMHLYQRQRASS